MTTFWITLLVISTTIVVYHHALHPLALKALARKKRPLRPTAEVRHHLEVAADPTLPTVTLIMPAHNEAAVIKEKIFNIAALDYPANKLTVLVACDGSTDGTAELARNAAQLPECQHLNLDVIEFPQNVGKVAVLNDTITKATSEIVALSDVSALLSSDCLLICAAHLRHHKTGVVCGSYHFFQSISPGEQAYWHYQKNVKNIESVLGSTLGVHGAFYAFKTELFAPLPTDTINDDFTLPASIIAQGYRCLHDERMIALELEQACTDMDFTRRQRIARGNVQQAIRHRALLHPRHGATAFNFMFGKFLRAFMPLFLLTVLVSSIALSLIYPLMWWLAAPQLLVYGLSMLALFSGYQPKQKLIRVVYYLISGHLALALGLIQYISADHSQPWKKTESTIPSQDKESQ